MTGIELIAQERVEQIEKHGFDDYSDAGYINDELIDAAMQYIGGYLISCWPETWDRKWYKTGNRIDELKKAGALIAAEIDRLQNNEICQEQI